MTIQRLGIALAAANLALLGLVGLLLSQSGAAAPTSAAPVLRGSALELVDDHGRVRARFAVQADGEVILRLLDQNGTIRVKLGASADGSGLLLANDATEPGVQILAKADGSSVRLRNKDGREKILGP
jgi:hypothetical protein